ncbi:MAG: hypothetical protein JW914_10250 [Syntrophaceae bacterium]|nr:hypothetical protein [Syntrophaceae bacterium]
MNRILIFLHYNPNGELASYVLHTLKIMRELYKRVVLVSNCPLKHENKKSLQTFCQKIMEREYNGLDFRGWKEALLEEGWNGLAKYDSLTLMDDSCFGPFFDMLPVYQQMEKADVDFWSITDIQKMNQYKNKLQINFLAFKSSIICSPVFMKFWGNADDHYNKKKFMRIHLSNLFDRLITKGFRYKSYIPLGNRSGFHDNQSDYNPYFLLQLGFPFIQTHIFAIFSHQLQLKYLVTLKSDYPLALIDEYCAYYFHPNISMKAVNKTFLISGKKLPSNSDHAQIKTALHLHVFYVDMLDQYIFFLKDEHKYFDLHITTDSESKKNQIFTKLKENNMDHLLKGIYIFKNHGRDVLPWLKIADILEKYDVVGHFHTKKSPTVSNWIAESWQNKVLENLIQPMKDILQLFQDVPRLGVVITDIPHYFSAISPKINAWGVNRRMVNIMWKKMKCKKDLDLKNLSTPIMPYGTMFWYRPQAFKPLFDLKLGDVDFPPEPIPSDGTVAHAIERLPVYLAWNEGYDFRIVINPIEIRTEFEVLSQISKSHDYRLGSFLLRLPRIIYRICRRPF